MHNAAFAELGIEWHYRLFPTESADLPSLLDSFEAKKIVGANVTMPHKRTIMSYLDHISEDARIIGAVNTVHVKAGERSGYNTDWVGFLNALNEAGVEPTGMHAVLLGAGGAARATCYSLARAGADSITVVNRTIEHGVDLVKDMAEAFPACHIAFRPLSYETLHQLSATIDLLVNTTSLGMHPNVSASPWPKEIAISSAAICCDLIYRPLQTLFLKQARKSGHATINGLGMLVHQGAVAFEIWTGQNAPLETMKEACLAALDVDP